MLALLKGKAGNLRQGSKSVPLTLQVITLAESSLCGSCARTPLRDRQSVSALRACAGSAASAGQQAASPQ